MNKIVIEKKNSNKNIPIVKKENYPREEYGVGSLTKFINDNGGIVLKIWANWKHWKVVVKY